MEKEVKEEGYDDWTLRHRPLQGLRLGKEFSFNPPMTNPTAAVLDHN